MEDLLGECGIEVSYAPLVDRFGPMFAAEIRRKRLDRMRAFTHRQWRCDEVYVKVKAVQHDLWRATDHEGEVLKSFATKEWDKAAALAFIKDSRQPSSRRERRCCGLVR